MKITVKKKTFLESLTIVTKAIKKGGLYPILECVLVDASKSNIILTCNDGKEITIRNEVEGQIIEKGKAAIDGVLLTNIIRNMPENQDIEIEVNNKKECLVTCGNNIKKNFPSKDETTYPNVMNVNKDNKVVINEYKLKKIIEKTSLSYDKNQSFDKDVLKGIYFSFNKDKLSAKSMNKFVLSSINESLPSDFGKFNKIIPGSSLEEVNKLIKGDVDKDVNIYINDKNVAFEFNKTLFNTNIIQGNYIETDKIINTEYSTKVNINRSEFIECLNRSMPFTNEIDKKPVVLNITDNEMQIKLNSISGDSYESLEVTKTGKDLNIAFNPSLLIQILNVIDDENITLYFSGPKQPIIIKDKKESYLYLLVAVII